MTSTIIIRTKHKNTEKIKKYDRKRLEQLSLKSLGEIPQLEVPNSEQQEWLERRMKYSATIWETWDQ